MPARAGGMRGCVAIATRAARACARASARGIPGTTTVRAGRACPTAVRMPTRGSFRPNRHCRVCRPISRRPCSAAGSRWPRWRARSARTPRPTAGRTRRTTSAPGSCARLYVPDEASFYDLDAHDRFVRVRGDVISRVLGEHVVDAKLFATIYERQIHNPRAFWAPYPLPSVALDDPAFVRPIPSATPGAGRRRRSPRCARRAGWSTTASRPTSPI